MNLNETTVVTKPTLDEEPKQFKAIVRHIMKYEADRKTAKLFMSDSRARLRRLSNLGISGHQPAIMAYCKMTKEEKDWITAAILKQKNAIKRKAEVLYEEHRERRTEAATAATATTIGTAKWDHQWKRRLQKAPKSKETRSSFGLQG